MFQNATEDMISARLDGILNMDIQQPDPSRSEASKILANIMLVQMEDLVVVKGGFVRDYIIHGDEAIDIDAVVKEDVDISVAASTLIERIRALDQLKIFAVTETDYLTTVTVTNVAGTFSIQCQFASLGGPFSVAADTTANNLGLAVSGICLSGPSALDLHQTLLLTQRKEFGVQSGNMKARVQERAFVLKQRGWIQVKVPTVPEIEDILNENQLYLRKLKMIPSTHGLMWDCHSTLMVSHTSTCVFQ